MKYSFLIVLLLSFLIVRGQRDGMYLGSGTVSFVSDAPLELITARSSELKGALDLEQQTFAFSFSVSSFEGFNSPLQQEHFNEHYLETKRYPKASFTGNMIGFRRCDEVCDQTITARGKMTIHGNTKVLNIPINITYDPGNGELRAEARFEALLEDYGIEIPLIVAAKISPVIQVDVTFVAKLSSNE